MKTNLETVKLLARDLRGGKEYPRSPRETLAGYVLAARAVLAAAKANTTRIARWISAG